MLEVIVAVIGFVLIGLAWAWRERGQRRAHAISMEKLTQELDAKNREVARQDGLRSELLTQQALLTQDLERERSELAKLGADLVGVRAALNDANQSCADERVASATLQTRLETLAEQVEEQIRVSEAREADLQRKLDEVNREREAVSKRVATFEAEEEMRISEHNSRVIRLDACIEASQAERERMSEEAVKAEALRLEALKRTWVNHETQVEQKIRLIAQELGIEYIDKEKFPHKGAPDNTLKICDELIIFDSKSPQGEDLSNFPTYVRTQAEGAKKYAKHEGVKKDIFFVVPTTAISCLESTYFAVGEYRVHVICEDSLRAVLMQLQRIEDYEFAEQLSPEDRESIVTSIGQMTHLLKRRLQVDHFFATESLKVLLDAEKLPSEILDRAEKVEQSSKLNPTVERRAKKIDTSALVKDAKKLGAKLAAEGLAPEAGNVVEWPAKEAVPAAPPALVESRSEPS